MRIFLLGCLLLTSIVLNAQKKLQRIILDNDITLIQVNTANCYEVELFTEHSNIVNIAANIEGEYTNELDVEIAKKGSTLVIEAGHMPSFEDPNDKLSAHKVVSILLQITIPSHKNIELFGTNSRIVIDGVFNTVSVSLSDGKCELNNVLGDVKVKTQSGTIKVSTESAKIKAKSKYGKVSFNPIPYNTTVIYELQTVTGNIELSKTE